MANKLRYTITFRECDYQRIINHLFTGAYSERAAYALCRLSKTTNENRILVREIIPVLNEDITEASWSGMKIKNLSFLRAMKKAHQTKQSFMFIHSHPSGILKHSLKDDNEESFLFKTAYQRIRVEALHSSLVLSDPNKPVARVWLEDGTQYKVDLIRVIGDKFRFFTNDLKFKIPQFFDRQVRAFGKDIQNILGLLNIGVVGLGGTGSAICEQLTRLGIKKLILIDGQKLDSTNVNRVYGSRACHGGKKKVAIAKKNINRIGLKTQVDIIDKPITFLSAARALRDCDIIFGCTDDNWGRAILNRIALFYHIPVFDMGVAIYSENYTIQSVTGRVTILLQGNGCLFCRGRINSKDIKSEMMSELDRESLIELIKQRYANELPDTAPSVIPFTTAIASLAITMFIHKITGFMGEERKSSEVLYFFDEGKLRTNKTECKNDCFYADEYYILKGDADPFLDITWRSE
jgi:hypothetical protein